MEEKQDVRVRIGEEPEKPREECPGCKSKGPRVLRAEDFPEEYRGEVQSAIVGGATLYECVGCRKRWAVVRQRVKKHEDGMVEILPATTGGGEGASPEEHDPRRRKVRRAVESINRRAIEQNIRLAAKDGVVIPPPPAPPQLKSSPEDARKERNRKKAERRRGRR